MLLVSCIPFLMASLLLTGLFGLWFYQDTPTRVLLANPAFESAPSVVTTVPAYVVHAPTIAPLLSARCNSLQKVETGLSVKLAPPEPETLTRTGLELRYDEQGEMYLAAGKALQSQKKWKKSVADLVVTVYVEVQDPEVDRVQIPVSLIKSDDTLWNIKIDENDLPTEPPVTGIWISVWRKGHAHIKDNFFIPRNSQPLPASEFPSYLAESYKALSKVASKELSVYNQHMADFVASSSEWLQQSLADAHARSSNAMEALAEHQATLESWRKQVAVKASEYRSTLPDLWDQHQGHLHEAWRTCSQRVGSAQRNVQDKLNVLQAHVNEEAARLKHRSELLRRQGSAALDFNAEHIVKARERARALRNQAADSLSHVSKRGWKWLEDRVSEGVQKRVERKRKCSKSKSKSKSKLQRRRKRSRS